MDLTELEMLLELFERAGLAKGLLLCALLLGIHAIRARWRRRRRKRVYREFQQELVLCRRRLERIQECIETRPRAPDRPASFMTRCLASLWHKWSGPGG